MFDIFNCFYELIFIWQNFLFVVYPRQVEGSSVGHVFVVGQTCGVEDVGTVIGQCGTDVAMNVTSRHEHVIKSALRGVISNSNQQLFIGSSEEELQVVANIMDSFYRQQEDTGFFRTKYLEDVVFENGKVSYFNSKCNNNNNNYNNKI